MSSPSCFLDVLWIVLVHNNSDSASSLEYGKKIPGLKCEIWIKRRIGRDKCCEFQERSIRSPVASTVNVVRL